MPAALTQVVGNLFLARSDQLIEVEIPVQQNTQRQIFSGHRVAAGDSATVGEEHDQGERKNDKSSVRPQRAFDRATSKDDSQKRESEHRDDRGPQLVGVEPDASEIYRIAARHEDREQVNRGYRTGRGRNRLKKPKVHEWSDAHRYITRIASA
jgi:hypothetical protein